MVRVLRFGLHGRGSELVVSGEDVGGGEVTGRGPHIDLLLQGGARWGCEERGIRCCDIGAPGELRLGDIGREGLRSERGKEG
jgi:hypothetical protein